MEPNYQDALHRLSRYGPTAACPYPQILLKRDTPLGLREVFWLMSMISGKHTGRPVVCWDFLPQLHLYVCSRWREGDGFDYLADNWLGAKDCLDLWIDNLGPQGTTTGCSVNLSHGHVLVTIQPIAEYTPDLATEIVRK